VIGPSQRWLRGRRRSGISRTVDEGIEFSAEKNLQAREIY